MKPIKLADLLTDPVHKVAPDTSVTQALERMRRLRIRALAVVDEQGHPMGIFTERDAVLAACRRAQTQEKAVQDIMSKPPLTMPADMGVLPAYRRMAESGDRQLIVVDAHGRLAGMVTEGAIIRHPTFRQRARSKAVAATMRRELAILPKEARVEDAVRLMAERRLDCVLVGKNGQLAGLLDLHDLLRVADAGEADLDRGLSDIMRRPVDTLPLNASFAEAIERMDQLQLGYLPVNDAEGRFVGLITEHAIVAELASGDAPPLPTPANPVIEYRSVGGRVSPWLFALMAVLLVFASEQVIEHFAQQRQLEHEKSGVLNQLSTLRARLEGLVNANVFLAHGLTAAIATRPDMDQASFGTIARGLMDERHALRNVAAAPNMVISLIYPLAGNEAALGLDYRSHPGQREAAVRARDSGQPVLAGPLPLRQGGLGFVAREPVFLAPAQAGGERHFWGLVSAVFDAETLYTRAGLRDTGLDLALRGTDARGARGPAFFGDAQLFNKQVVTLDVTLPGGSWQLAAMPAKGWGRADTGIDLIRWMGLIAALLAGFMAYRLVSGTQALAGQKARLRALLNTLPDLIWLKDPSGVFLACNPRFEQLLGARESDIKGKTDHDVVPAELSAFIRENDRAAIAAGRPQVSEEWVSFASDGHRELLETIKTPVYDTRGHLLGVLGVARNITERKQADEQIYRLNRLYGVLSGIGEALIGLRDPQRLFDEACRIAVEVGGLRMAWLGMVDPDGHDVRPLAHAGVVDHYLEHMHISLGEDDRARGPTGRALHAGQHVVCNDIADDPGMAPWRDAALVLGYRASAAFPIRVAGQVRGAFNLYADSAGFFDAKELELLDELAKDIGFALEFIEADRARETLNRRMLDLLESMSDGFISLDREWRFQYVNRKAGEIFARAPDELIGRPIWSEFPTGVGSPFQKAVEQAMNGAETIELEEYFPLWGRWFGNRIYPTQDGISVFFADITERKRIEAALVESESRLRLFIEHAPAALAMFDGEMRYLAVSRRWLTDYQLETSDILGLSHYEVFPDLPERWKAVHRRGLAGELVRAEEDSFERADGTRQWLHWEVRPWFTADSEVGGIVIFSEDTTERVVAEQALRESEARFVATFEQAAVGIAIVSPQGRWLRVNQKLCEIVGYDETELMATTFQDITHPDDLDADLDHVHQMLAHEIDHYSMEKRYRHKDGSVIWINLTVALVWKSDEAPDYFIKVIEDISARKTVEAALHESESHYRQLFERNPAPMLVYERGSLRLLAVNEAFLHHYGYSRDEALALRLTDLYPAAEKQRIIDVAASLVGLAYVGEWHHLKNDGSQITIEARSHDLQYEGRAARIAVITDITERKQAEQALRDSEARYRSLIELAPFPAVFSSLRDGSLLYGNRRAERLYGLQREAGIGLPASTFYQDVAQRDQVIANLRKEGKVEDLEVRMQTVDGRPFWALVSASIVEFKNEPAIFAAINDITARKQMEDDIRQLNAELEDRVRQRTAELAAANKELETFTYSVSHDLKAPLRGIDGYSRLLLEDYQKQLDEPGRQLLGYVRSGVAQMSQLIEDLLTYSRMERRSLSEQTVDLSRLVARVLNELQADIQARGMLVEVSLQDLTARADPEGLAIVLRNLVDNALKFSRGSHPPTLSISGLSGEKSITLKIKDNGIGFDMQFHNRIFEIFQRLQRAEDYPGTGVGLAIVHKAMQRMGGRVWAESVPGQGTAFYLELPR